MAKTLQMTLNDEFGPENVMEIRVICYATKREDVIPSRLFSSV